MVLPPMLCHPRRVGAAAGVHCSTPPSDLGMNSMDAFDLMVFMTAWHLVGIGLLKVRVAQAPRVRSIMETLVLGVIAAGSAYVLGDLLEKLIAG